jgi:peptidyl-prolyl cis-trans isomerase A (cyclophilin A)
MTPLRSLIAAVVLLAPVTASAQAPVLPKIEVTQSGVQLDGLASLSTDAVFEVGDAAIKPALIPLLDAIARALATSQSPKFIINVYTDDAAPDGDQTGAWLQKLTQRRADAIKAHFQKRGVPAKKLTATGHGPASPVGSNQTEIGRRANRRIEIAVESEVRPPIAADLAVYLKAIKGTGDLFATIATNRGTLRCKLFEAEAPMTVANFVGLATGQKPWIDPRTKQVVKGKPLYDGLVFHRVIPQFMIQGGDPLGAGSGGPGYQFGDEISPTLRHAPGSLSMANAGPGTNGSQFFITEVAPDWLNGKHTIFGKCKEIEVIKAITGVPKVGESTPQTPITMKVTISKS